MKKTFKSAWAAIIIPLCVIVPVLDFPEAVTAKPAIEISATKQLRRDYRQIYENYYADNYRRAIARRIVRKPSNVRNFQQALDLAERAIARRDRNEGARRIAQALVMLEESHGTEAALDLERSLDGDIVEKTGQRLRDYLPLLASIFPTSRQTYYNGYQNSYERAIANRLIRRPSHVTDPDEAVELGLQALDRGRDNEAAVRFAQAIVMVEEINGSREATNFEQQLNEYLQKECGISLWDDIPLYRRIFSRLENL
ncbi:MAG TPA: hypothetical protein V6D28_25770 [Leptolyngbyaceae cyanobacterium]